MKKNIVVASVLVSVMVMPTVVNANSVSKLQVASSFVQMGEELTAYQDISINRFALNNLINKVTMGANFDGEVYDLEYVTSDNDMKMIMKDSYSEMDMTIIGNTLYTSTDGKNYDVIPFTDEEAMYMNSFNLDSENVIKLSEGYTKEVTEDIGSFFFGLKETALGSKKYVKDSENFNTKVYKYTFSAKELSDLYAELLRDIAIYSDASAAGVSEVDYDNYELTAFGQEYINMYSYDFGSDNEYDMFVYLQDGVVSRIGFSYEEPSYDIKYDFDVYFLNKDNLISDISFVLKDGSVDGTYEMKLYTDIVGKDKRAEQIDFYQINSKTYAKTELFDINIKSDYATNAKDNVVAVAMAKGQSVDLKLTNNIIDNKYVFGFDIKNSVWEPILGEYVGDYSFWMEMYNSDEVIEAPVK